MVHDILKYPDIYFFIRILFQYLMTGPVNITGCVHVRQAGRDL